MKPILEIKNISKKFKIAHHGKAEPTFRESLLSIFKPESSSKEDFWALEDVSFDIYPGESVGIIGRNGAGKSTLLKILSKITPPSSGKIISRGRIASLLEVGTGFHSELTGRENIYLNGSILGLRRAEITRHFDAIVDFSGVDQFLDTPIKHYSSGMQLRLAFAVAAHLEPEILIIDEVLAVGDAEFQKKCIGKMSEVSKSGRTILFVSHNMGAIHDLCSKAILLKNGRLQKQGSVQEITNIYLDNNFENSTYVNSKASATQEVCINKAVLTKSGVVCSEFLMGDQVEIKVTIKVNKDLKNKGLLGIALLDSLKNKLFTSHLTIQSSWGTDECELVYRLPPSFLVPGIFSFDIAVFSQGAGVYQYVKDVCQFRIVDDGSGLYYDTNYGVIKAPGTWDKL